MFLGCSRFVLFVLLVTMLCSWVVLVSQFGIPGLSSRASEARLNVRGPFYFLFVSSAWTFFSFLPLNGWLANNGKRRKIATALLLILTSVLLASRPDAATSCLLRRCSSRGITQVSASTYGARLHWR